MKLFYHPISSSARRVAVTAHQLGIELEPVIIDLGRAEDRATLAAINPNKKVPVLVDGDLVLWESHAIAQYLCDRTPGQTLYPSELRARADVQRWLYWISAHLGPSIGPISYERLWKKLVEGPSAPVDQATIDRHEKLFRQQIAILDTHLADRTFVVGKHLTLADISVVSTLMYMEATQLPVDDYANVMGLVRRTRDLAAWKSTEPARFS